MGNPDMVESEKNPIFQIVMNFILGFLYILLNVVFYVVVFIVAKNLCENTYQYAYQIFGNVSVSEAPGTDIKIKIEPRNSSMEIATMLERKRVVVNRYTFFIRTKLTIGKEHPIFPGTYMLNNSMCYNDILKIITDPSQRIGIEEDEGGDTEDSTDNAE